MLPTLLHIWYEIKISDMSVLFSASIDCLTQEISGEMTLFKLYCFVSYLEKYLLVFKLRHNFGCDYNKISTTGLFSVHMCPTDTNTRGKLHVNENII